MPLAMGWWCSRNRSGPFSRRCVDATTPAGELPPCQPRYHVSRDGRTGPIGSPGPPAKEGMSRRRVHTQVTHPARTIIGTDSADAPGPAVGPGNQAAPATPNPAESRDTYQPPAFAGLAKVGRSVWSKQLASEPLLAEPDEPARPPWSPSLHPWATTRQLFRATARPRGRFEVSNRVPRDGEGIRHRVHNG